jgi:hypothetical protein
MSEQRKRVVLGYRAEGRGAYTVDIGLETLEREKVSIDGERVTDGVTVSICGACPTSLGQCADSIRSDLEAGKINLVLPKEDVERLLDIWDRWHLNDMKAGTRAQEEFIDQHGLRGKEYTDKVAALKDAGLLEDGGYKYGTAWLYEPVPTDVLAFLVNLKTPESVADQEADLDSVEPFSVELAGKEVVLSAAYKGTDTPKWSKRGEPHPHFVLRVGTDEGATSFNYWGSINDGMNGKDSLNRREILSAFQMILSDTASGQMSFEDFVKEFGYSMGTREERAAAKTAHNGCVRTKEKLEGLGLDEDLRLEMENELRDMESSHYSGIAVNDAEAPKLRR